MTPAALVAELRARGVVLWPDGEMLRIRPVSRVSPEELQALREAKPEVLRLVTHHATAEVTPEAEARALLEHLLGAGASFQVLREDSEDVLVWFGSAATVTDAVRAEVARLKPGIIRLFLGGHPRSRRTWGRP